MDKKILDLKNQLETTQSERNQLASRGDELEKQVGKLEIEMEELKMRKERDVSMNERNYRNEVAGLEDTFNLKLSESAQVVEELNMLIETEREEHKQHMTQVVHEFQQFGFRG